jgi:hypothetical protein
MLGAMAKHKSALDDLVERVLELRPVAHVRELLRTWRGWVIAIVVAGGLLLPIHYYLPTHRDPHDERFAWRMFSPMRTATCTAKWLKNETPLDITTEFHEAWIVIAKRGRFRVVEAMGAHLCEKYGNAKISVDLDCKYIDQPPEHYGGFNMCMVPLI